MTDQLPVPKGVLDDLRAQLVDRHQELVRYGLVVWTAGNVSARVPDADLFLIKASGVDYEGLHPDQMVLCHLDGTLAEETDLSSSSDTAAHAYVYRHMDHVGGVVHTHSPYACAFAAVGEPVPCVLTGIADEFGGEIPVGPFARIGNDDIGKAGRVRFERRAGRHHMTELRTQRLGDDAVGRDRDHP